MLIGQTHTPLAPFDELEVLLGEARPDSRNPAKERCRLPTSQRSPRPCRYALLIVRVKSSEVQRPRLPYPAGPSSDPKVHVFRQQSVRYERWRIAVKVQWKEPGST